MNIRKAIKQIALGGTIAAMSTMAFAATDGPTGFTSTGDLTINLQVDDEVRISAMTDINLTFTGVDETGTSPACVYRNTAATYEITGTGDGLGSAYTLTDGTNTVPYSVTFDDTTGAASLPNGIAVARSSASSVDDTCGGATDDTVAVTVLASDASSLPQGTYSGVLYLLVAPN